MPQHSEVGERDGDKPESGPVEKKLGMRFIEGINDKLEAYGDRAITADKYSSFGAVGYDWQFIVDAVNDVLGVDGWYYDLVGEIEVEKRTRHDEKKDKDITTYYAEAMVKIYVNLGVDGMFATRGVTVGRCQNIDRANARKGSISDACKKGFSLFSIGAKAMRGELKASMGSSSSAGKQTKGKEKPAAKAASPKDTKDKGASEKEQRSKLIAAILKSSGDLGLSEGARLDLKNKHTGGKMLGEATIDELEALYKDQLELENARASLKDS